VWAPNPGSRPLVLLPIIIVGQNLQAKASDKRAEDTYNDAAAVLHDAIEIQKHLAAQDLILSQLIAAAKTSPQSMAAGQTGPATAQ